MSMGEQGMERGRPSPAGLLAGIVLILSGTCIQWAGVVGALIGAAGLLDGSRSFLHSHIDPVAFLILVVSLGAALTGAYGVQEGVRMVRGKPRRRRGSPQRRAGG